MVEILKLLQERDKVAFEQSKIILKLIEEPLNKALQYFTKDARKIDWNAIDLIAEDKFVYIYGFITVNLGETISNGGKLIQVDEQYLKENPINDIRIMLPIPVVEKGDPEEILDHLRIYWELTRVMSRQDIINVVHTMKLDSLRDILQNMTVLDRITKPKEFEGFNVENLSDFQVSQIKYFIEEGSKAKN